MNDHSHETDDVLTALWEDVASSEGAARAHALCHLGEYFFHAGDIDDALAAADAAKDLFLAADEIDEAAHCDHNAAVALHVLGRFDEAVARHEDAVAGHMGGEWTRAAACCRIHLAGLYEEAGHLADARTQLRAASEELEQMGHVGLQGEAMLARSRVAWKRGRFAAALAAASKALPLLEAAAPVGMVADGHVARARALLVLGHLGDARKAWRRARAIYEALDDGTAVAECDLALAEVAVRASDDAAATLAMLAELRGQRKDAGDPTGVARVDVLRSRLLLHVDPSAALEIADGAEAVARACADVELATEARMRAGSALVRSGEVKAGLKCVRAARRRFDAHHRVDLVIEARLFAMETHVAAGDGAAAKREAASLYPMLRYSGLEKALTSVLRVRGVPDRPLGRAS